MSGNKELFYHLKNHDGSSKVTFADNSKGRILGKGSVGNENSLAIHDVIFVEGLTYNLLSISQLCDKGFHVKFESSKCYVLDKDDNVLFVACRTNDIYTCVLDSIVNHHVKCLSVVKDSP